MTRRQLLSTACAWAAAAAVGRSQHQHVPPQPSLSPAGLTGDADITLRIAETTLDLGFRRMVRTLAYNGQVPGPLLRVPAGRPLTIDVWNQSREQDIVHWHGLHIPSNVDGAYEAGTPGVPPNGGRQRYTFVPEPPGTHWYHTHNAAGRDFRKSTYTGQFGLFVVDGGADPSDYDQDVPLLFHEWEPRLSASGPLEVEFRHYSINGRMLGAGEPIRVRAGQRVLFRLVNASATLTHRVALPGHVFEVRALDGARVPMSRQVAILELAPGERIDAIVVMNRSGVWILGAVDTQQRDAGMGVVVEYAGSSGPPRWEPPPPSRWDYSLFGTSGATREPDERLPLVFRSVRDGHAWTINGKSFPRTDPIIVRTGRRYRWVLDNQSAEHHPMHLHRHRFEIVRYAGTAMSGVFKDVVVVPAWKQVEIDVLADHPGPTLFHCHQQFHMDMGFMTLMQYAP